MNFNRKTLREAMASLLAVFLLLSFGPVAALAQGETGQITVKATDPQGSVGYIPIFILRLDSLPHVR